MEGVACNLIGEVRTFDSGGGVSCEGDERTRRDLRGWSEFVGLVGEGGGFGMEKERGREGWVTEIGVGLVGLAERGELLELGAVLKDADRKSPPALGVR